MSVPVVYPGSADLAPFVHWRHRVPYINQGRRISRVRLKVQHGRARRASVVHRIEAAASVLRGSRIIYGARWVCGGTTRDAVLVSSPPSSSGLCATCKEHGPAVYRFFDAAERLLYIGSTISIARRRKEHMSAPWWPAVVREQVERYSTRADAAAAELRAIQAETPIHNRTHLTPSRWEPKGVRR